MAGLVINGIEYPVEGLTVLNWNDDKRLKYSPEDGRKRKTSWVRSIVVHTTQGIPGGSNKTPQRIIPGGKDGGWEFNTARFWTNSDRSSGAHLIIDSDGSVGCIADLAAITMYHAGQRYMNDYSIGIEIYQRTDGGIYEDSLDACVILVDFLCKHFGIQRQLQWPYRGRPVRRLSKGGRHAVGVFGHRDVSNNRGSGDPGDFIMQRLMDVGYEAFDLDADEDKEAWRERQKALGLTADGVAGPATQRALEKAGYLHGLWALGKEPPKEPEPDPQEEEFKEEGDPSILKFIAKGKFGLEVWSSAALPFIIPPAEEGGEPEEVHTVYLPDGKIVMSLEELDEFTVE